MFVATKTLVVAPPVNDMKQLVVSTCIVTSFEGLKRKGDTRQLMEKMAFIIHEEEIRATPPSPTPTYIPRILLKGYIQMFAGLVLLLLMF